MKLRNLFLLFFLLLTSMAGAQTVQKLSQEAQKAYQAKDYKRFLQIYQTLDSLRPMHPTVLYNLAAGYALNNEAKQATNTLEKLILINASPAVAKDSDFVSIWTHTDFQRITKQITELNLPVQHSQEAFRIKEKDLHIESIGHDAQTNTFYLGSIHKRKIIQIDAEGNISDFTTEGQDEAWAILGLRIDTKKRVLWAVSTAMPEMKGYNEKDKNKSKVLQYDLASRKLLASYTIEDGNPHFFGDLILHPDGTVYVSDSDFPAIYQINPKEKEKKLSLFVKTPLRSLQGLAFDAKATKLFVADYASQLYVIDLKTKAISPLKIPATVSTKGTDGLYFWNNTLIAIQNGVTPKRVIQLFLNKTQSEITDFRIIEANNPLFEEPTLGVLVGKFFYYVANSSWGAYQNGELQTDKLQDIVILKTLLKKP